MNNPGFFLITVNVNGKVSHSVQSNLKYSFMNKLFLLLHMHSEHTETNTMLRV